MTNMRLAIMGASVRAAAFSALEAGFEVVAADLFADCDLAARCPAAKMPPDPHAFVRWLAERDIDGWMVTGSWENYPDQMERMAELRPLLGCATDVMRTCKQPIRLVSLFSAGDVRFPETQFTPPPGSGWLVKAISSAGGLGVDDWLPGSPVPENCYWQRKIEGTPIAAAYVAAAGCAVLLGVTEQLIDRRWTHSQPYHYAGSVGPYTLANSRLAEGALAMQLAHAGELLASKLGVVGVFGIDFVLDDAGAAWVVDVNPRYTASMEVVERFTGMNIVAAHVAACTRGELPAHRPEPACYAGKAYLFARREVVFRRLPELQLADIPHQGDVIPRGKPICTLIVDAEEYGDVQRRLQQDAKRLESWLCADEV